MSDLASRHAKSKASSVAEFVSDIEPFFRKRDVFLVDVGAGHGKTFSHFLASPLNIDHAFLVEDDPKTFALLQDTVAQLEAEAQVTCLNMAISDAPGTAKMQRTAGGSQMLDGKSDTAAETFDVDMHSLDSLRSMHPDRRISVLNVDASGREAQVLEGAKTLLSEQAIDVLYIEAGLKPDAAQLTHYRKIEDALNAHGYRVFKIYDQSMDTVEDRAELRRMKLAFISPSIADKYSLGLVTSVAEQETKIATLTSDLDESLRDLAKLTHALNESDKKAFEMQGFEDPEVTEKLASLERQAARLQESYEKAQGQYDRIVKSTSWRITAPLRAIVRTLRGR